MTPKTLLFVLSYCVFTHCAKAQQLPLVAQDPEFHGIINPASLNSDFIRDDRNLSVGVSVRQQWLGLKGLSPSTQYGRGEYIVDGDNRWLIGAYFMHDKVGITNNTGLYARAAYVLNTGSDARKGGLSFGLNLGVVNWFLRTNNLSVNQLDRSEERRVGKECA